jgi:hypothetical protein
MIVMQRKVPLRKLRRTTIRTIRPQGLSLLGPHHI